VKKVSAFDWMESLPISSLAASGNYRLEKERLLIRQTELRTSGQSQDFWLINKVAAMAFEAIAEKSTDRRFRKLACPLSRHHGIQM